MRDPRREFFSWKKKAEVDSENPQTLQQNALGYAYFPDNVAQGSTEYYLDGASIMASSVPGGSEAPVSP